MGLERLVGSKWIGRKVGVWRELQKYVSATDVHNEVGYVMFYVAGKKVVKSMNAPKRPALR